MNTVANRLLTLFRDAKSVRDAAAKRCRSSLVKADGSETFVLSDGSVIRYVPSANSAQVL